MAEQDRQMNLKPVVHGNIFPLTGIGMYKNTLYIALGQVLVIISNCNAQEFSSQSFKIDLKGSNVRIEYFKDYFLPKQFRDVDRLYHFNVYPFIVSENKQAVRAVFWSPKEGKFLNLFIEWDVTTSDEELRSNYYFDQADMPALYHISFIMDADKQQTGIVAQQLGGTLILSKPHNISNAALMHEMNSVDKQSLSDLYYLQYVNDVPSERCLLKSGINTCPIVLTRITSRDAQSFNSTFQEAVKFSGKVSGFIKNDMVHLFDSYYVFSFNLHNAFTTKPPLEVAPSEEMSGNSTLPPVETILLYIRPWNRVFVGCDWSMEITDMEVDYTGPDMHTIIIIVASVTALLLGLTLTFILVYHLQKSQIYSENHEHRNRIWNLTSRRRRRRTPTPSTSPSPNSAITPLAGRGNLSVGGLKKNSMIRVLKSSETSSKSTKSRASPTSSKRTSQVGRPSSAVANRSAIRSVNTDIVFHEN